MPIYFEPGGLERAARILARSVVLYHVIDKSCGGELI